MTMLTRSGSAGWQGGPENGKAQPVSQIPGGGASSRITGPGQPADAACPFSKLFDTDITMEATVA